MEIVEDVIKEHEKENYARAIMLASNGIDIWYEGSNFNAVARD
jgi:hypothetical protein